MFFFRVFNYVSPMPYSLSGILDEKESFTDITKAMKAFLNLTLYAGRC